MKLLARLARQTGVYALGNVAVKVAGLLLAPLMLNAAYLPVEDFGAFALLMVSAQFAILVVGLGLSTGLLRFMAGDSQGLDTDRLPFTALVVTIGIATATGLAIWAFSGTLADLLANGSERSSVVVLLGIYVGFKVVAAVPLTVLRVKERAGWYTLAIAAELSVLIILAWILLARNGSGLYGLVAAYAGAAGVSAFVLVGAMVRRISWRFDPSSLRPLLQYGVPLVLASLAGWFLNAGDRYLLRWLADSETVAAYEWSARIAGLVNMLFVQSFQLAFTVLGMKALADRDAGFYRRTMRHYAVWTGGAVLGIGLFTGEGMRLLVWGVGVDPFYLGAETLAFPLALGFMGYGIYVIVNNVLLMAGRTRVVGAVVLGAALLNALLNLVFIPAWGAMGAAVATVISYAALAIAASLRARRELRIAYPWRGLLLVIVFVLLLFVAGWLVGSWTFWPRFVSRCALLVAYGVLVVATGVYPWAVLRDVVLRWRRSGLENDQS